MYGGVLHQLKEVAQTMGLKSADAQLGKTKLFLKQPETIFAMEEVKNGVVHGLAAKIQRAWRRYVCGIVKPSHYRCAN